MARTADLGWPVARCDRVELELLEPASEDTPASSFRVQGWENILRLRDLINEVEGDNHLEDELEKDLPGMG